ncbi:oligosaccharide flippase family protein [Selenomonas caprae]|uniref:Oligosaccharide flippase family protein n=1 Tax=Selenomonas caprae TaxID=2606905 RepID=A0A5D6WPX8_9FIRM|nr:oligosaccharide flippase family protein [Selenomonas caprae]TYZ29953.1 oligosaccharide flippase family protein [Selenomonas caprae]
MISFILGFWKKFLNMPITAKAALVYLFGMVLQRALGFITTPIFTRLMTVEEYGAASVYYTTEQMLGIVAMFCLGAGWMDIGLQDYKEERHEFVFSMLVLSNVITIITGICVCVIYPWIKEFLRVEPMLLVVMFTNFLFSPAMFFWLREERFGYRYKWPAIFSVGSSILSTITVVVVLLIMPFNRLYERVLGAALPLVACYVGFYFHIAKRVGYKLVVKYWRPAILFNLPLIPHYLSLFFLGGSDRLMIAALVGEREAGFYSVSYTVAMLVMMVWTAVNSSLVPFIIKCYEVKNYPKISNTVLPIITFFGVICVFIALLAPEVIKVLATDEFLEAVYIVPPVICGAFFSLLYYLFTNVLYLMKKPQYVMIASISTGVLNVGLNYLFIPGYGYVAAGYTTLVCYLLQAVMDYLISYYFLRMNVYDMKYLSIVSIMVGVFSFGVLYVYQLPSIVRYILILLILAGSFIKRQEIIRYFKW